MNPEIILGLGGRCWWKDSLVLLAFQKCFIKYFWRSSKHVFNEFVQLERHGQAMPPE